MLHGSHTKPSRWFVRTTDLDLHEVARITYPAKDGTIMVKFLDTGEVRRIEAIALIQA